MERQGKTENEEDVRRETSQKGMGKGRSAKLFATDQPTKNRAPTWPLVCRHTVRFEDGGRADDGGGSISRSIAQK